VCEQIRKLRMNENLGYVANIHQKNMKWDFGNVGLFVFLTKVLTVNVGNLGKAQGHSELNNIEE
jgi:hypothetical protein